MSQVPPEFAPFLNLKESQRDKAVAEYLCQGFLPTHLLQFVPVPLQQGGVVATLYVSPDYVGLGNGDQFLRTPLPAPLLQTIADTYGCCLPTVKIVDAIHLALGAHHVPFKGFQPNPGESRHSTRLWVASNDRIQAKLGGRFGLVTDHKKDVVVGPTQMANPEKVAIYGGWNSEGKRVQGLNVVSHSLTYCDYSQCGRLIRPVLVLEGVEWSFEDVYKHPSYRSLLVGASSDITSVPRYKING